MGSFEALHAEAVVENAVDGISESSNEASPCDIAC